MSLLGIDVGTTGCKAAAYSLDGSCLASAYREYPVLRPAGFAELDSHAVLDRIKNVIREVAGRTKPDPITALSVSSMGEAITPVSTDGKVLGNSILASLDTRGREYLDHVVARVGRDEFCKINPNVLAVTYSLPKLLWIKHNQPDLYRRADKFLLWGDLVVAMLGCEPVTSFSLANRTLLFDIRKEDWSPVLLEAAGFDRAKLPKPVASGTIAGEIPEKIAVDLGLAKGVKVVVGGHDQSCNALGAGVATAGKAVCGIGTFECITPVYDHIPDPLTMVNAGLNVEHHILPGLYVSFIYNQAGSLVRWFRDTFATSDKRRIGGSADIYDVLAAEMPNEPTRLFALPYFEPTGAPEFVTNASGAIFGIKTDTTRGEILKSIMEGVTFYFVESIEKLKAMGIDTSEFVASGGGAKSDKWLQIKSDILGVPFVQLRVAESGTVGCAILAGVATGVFKTPEEGISLLVRRGKRFEPDSARNKIYRDKYAAYKSLVHRYVRETS